MSSVPLIVETSTSCGAPRSSRCPSPVRARSHGVVTSRSRLPFIDSASIDEAVPLKWIGPETV